MRLVVRWYRMVNTGGFGLATIVMGSMLAPALPNPTAVACVLGGIGFMLFAMVRAARSAAIEFRNDDVLLYGLLRTKRIKWSQVRNVEIGRGTSATMLPWRVPYFELDDGSSVRADEIRSLREPSIVDDVVAEARRRIQKRS